MDRFLFDTILTWGNRQADAPDPLIRVSRKNHKRMLKRVLVDLFNQKKAHDIESKDIAHLCSQCSLDDIYAEEYGGISKCPKEVLGEQRMLFEKPEDCESFKEEPGNYESMVRRDHWESCQAVNTEDGFKKGMKYFSDLLAEISEEGSEIKPFLSIEQELE